MNNELVEKIQCLKEHKNATIFSHFYTDPSVQVVADFLGDSLSLSIKAKDVKSQIILFAGVHFMAETAKILVPQKKVLIPVLDAGCSLADSCSYQELLDLKKKYPNAIVVSYVNTGIDIKSLTDVCCTSSNAVKVINSIPQDREIIFCPDRNLGNYVKKITGRKNLILWDGACKVHERFSAKNLIKAKQLYKDAEVLIHPECKEEVVEMGDFVGSTAAMITYAKASSATRFIVVTESGILCELKKQIPSKEFIPLVTIEGDSCNKCMDMRKITLENIYYTLKNETPEVIVDEKMRQKAERAINNMIAIK
ncbi:MAG: quinolinate synthase NadA [Alistipes sp.]|nr:quinolinate synthase NadA [Candidatus Alistipes equi]